jgi:opacity protein-like surface antigen
MINNSIKAGLLILIAIVFVQSATAQYSSKKVRTKHQVYTDSLKNVHYDRIFPILGQGAYARGFDIPYPMGIMANFIWLDQGLLIDNLQLGLQTSDKDIPLTEVDFIQFGENTNTSYSINFRPDVWVLPFLNVYGLFGAGHSRTEVNLVAPVELKSVVEQKVSTVGFGVLGAGGIGPIWISVDANFTWNKPELLEEATAVNVLGLRMGHSFVFKQRPDRNITVWAGAMRLHMSTQSSGAVALGAALPPDVWDRADQIVSDYWEWYGGLNPITDALKIKVADEILTPIVDRIDNADGSAIILYAMDKQTKQLWNGVIGAQFQIDKHWQIRTEIGLIGDRRSYLASVNYRILGFKSNPG